MAPWTSTNIRRRGKKEEMMAGGKHTQSEKKMDLNQYTMMMAEGKRFYDGECKHRSEKKALCKARIAVRLL